MALSQGSEGAPTPVPVAFLLCDQVISDEATKKKTIVGVFDRILLGKFPGSHSPVAVYVRVVDAEGEYKLRVEYVQVASQSVLAVVDGTVHVKDRLRAGEFFIPLPPLPIPSPGEYEFRLWMNDRYIHRVRFNAVQQSTGGSQ